MIIRVKEIQKMRSKLQSLNSGSPISYLRIRPGIDILPNPQGEIPCDYEVYAISVIKNTRISRRSKRYFIIYNEYDLKHAYARSFSESEIQVIDDQIPPQWVKVDYEKPLTISNEEEMMSTTILSIHGYPFIVEHTSIHTDIWFDEKKTLEILRKGKSGEI